MVPVAVAVHGTLPVAQVEQLAAVQEVDPELQEQLELQTRVLVAEAAAMAAPMVALVDLVLLY
jgi:hypothetical protein